MTAFFVAIRWLHLGSLMLLFGGAALRMLLTARLPVVVLPDGRGRLVVALTALVTAFVWMGLTVAQMAGDLAALSDPQSLSIGIGQTLFGQVFVVRAALLALVCAGLARGWREHVIAGLSGASLALISVTAHAAEASPAHFTAIGTVSDGLHLLTGAFWIGGLALLARLYRARPERGVWQQAVAIFAEWGMVAVGILVMTGMLNALTILLGGEGHDTAVYLTVLAAKLALVAVMVGLALFNHFRLLPRADGEAALARNIRLELGLGLAVVGLAALLSLLPPTGG